MEKYLQSILSVRNLSAAYGARPVLSDISMEIRRGEIVGILGLNGSGKSTLLKALMGVTLAGLRRTAGQIALAERDLTNLSMHQRARAGISYLPQRDDVFRSLTVTENLWSAIGKGSNSQSRFELVFEAFPSLRHHRYRRAGLMSGGQQRMLGVAMAIAREAKVLLADEPSVGLAPALVQEVFGLLHTVSRQEGLAILVVEQRQAEVLLLADRIISLEEGRIVDGSSQAVSEEASPPRLLCCQQTRAALAGSAKPALI